MGKMYVLRQRMKLVATDLESLFSDEEIENESSSSLRALEYRLQ